ncbi:hypothetical protein FBALC1_04662 [Flavobacteriales bacterium ALC-1]|nr:hypothetical protein FBALC1_04662 [Flavobacteriales bacterium ALC-1]
MSEVYLMDKKQITNKISRQQAIKKIRKYVTLTAVGTFIVLNPLQAQSSSPPDPGGNPFD